MAIMTRALGGTGADVTILSYGAMELRGRPRGPEIADEDAGRLLNSVLDSGINLIDTSPDYGRSEELIGTYIQISDKAGDSRAGSRRPSATHRSPILFKRTLPDASL